jgi:hypothetical protein
VQTKWDFAGSTDMWSTSAGGHLMKVVNLTGFTVYCFAPRLRCYLVALASLGFWTMVHRAEFGLIGYGKDDRPRIHQYDVRYTGLAYLNERTRNVLMLACWASCPACAHTP